MFDASDTPYVFTCDPLPGMGNFIRVVWRRFRNESLLRQFLASGLGANDSVITGDEEDFTLAGDRDSILTVANNPNSEPEDVVYYFVPSFQLSGGYELVTGETMIFGECAI